MRCFYHPDSDAVGSCKACSKGLCSECAADLGEGLACRGQHEDLVAELNTLINRNSKAQLAAARGGILLLPAFFTFMGMLLVGTDLYRGRGLLSFGVLMGFGFIAFGSVCYLYNRSIFRPAKDA